MENQKTYTVEEILKPKMEKIGALVCLVDDLVAENQTLRKQLSVFEAELNELRAKSDVEK